jgi:hypothetical protein
MPPYERDQRQNEGRTGFMEKNPCINNSTPPHVIFKMAELEA